MFLFVFLVIVDLILCSEDLVRSLFLFEFAANYCSPLFKSPVCGSHNIVKRQHPFFNRASLLAHSFMNGFGIVTTSAAEAGFSYL